MTTLRQEITYLSNAPPPLSEAQVNTCYDWAWNRFHQVYPARSLDSIGRVVKGRLAWKAVVPSTEEEIYAEFGQEVNYECM